MPKECALKPSFREARAAWPRAMPRCASACGALVLWLCAVLPASAAPAGSPHAQHQAAAPIRTPAASAAAPARRVEPFDLSTWPQLARTSQRPTVVVFSTTDCSHCPAVLKDLHAHRARQKLQAPLVAVVMDVAPGGDDAGLLANPHYASAQRLLAFDGQPAALRHAVNPSWRGVTPYVALLRPGAAPTFALGMPSEAQLRAWAAAAEVAR